MLSNGPRKRPDRLAARPSGRFAPEVVYVRRMLAWITVGISGVLGVELVITGHVAIGLLLIVAAAGATVVLRSGSLVQSLRHASRDLDQS